jgi:hypothetical protein
MAGDIAEKKSRFFFAASSLANISFAIIVVSGEDVAGSICIPFRNVPAFKIHECNQHKWQVTLRRKKAGN